MQRGRPGTTTSPQLLGSLAELKSQARRVANETIWLGACKKLRMCQGEAQSVQWRGAALLALSTWGHAQQSEAHAPGGSRGYVGSMERGRGQQSASERAGRGERSIQVAGAGDGGAPREA